MHFLKNSDKIGIFYSGCFSPIFTQNYFIVPSQGMRGRVNYCYNTFNLGYCEI